MPFAAAVGSGGVVPFAHLVGISVKGTTQDALASKQHQTLIDLISEGVISGFPSATGSQGSTEYNTSALKDVFLNGTQVLQQAAGTSPSDTDFNFQNVTFEPRFGTSNQTAISAISASESETAVGVVVTQSTPVSRSITDTNIDAVRVTLAFPQLQKFESDGDIDGSTVDLTIQTIQNDGTTTTVITDTVKGRAASTYFRDYKINFPSGTSFPVTIRVNRTTADSTESTHQNAFQWSSFTEIINEARAYADSAHVGLRFDAETFPSIPTRMYRVKGTLIKIPHNATVRADGSISYSGTFNGTFKTDKEWTNDPAWVLYDLLTTSKGFGDHIDTTQLDVFSFYSASVYCAEQVDDMTGTGNTEPRFATNVVLNTQRDAYSLINDLCSVMRVMPFYSAGVINISQDRPTDPSYIYNLSNVTEAGFSYSNSSKSTKATVVNVAYFDNETQSIDYETVEDTALQAKYGVVVKNLRGFATTSRGQAARLGKWFLYTQSNEAEICTFRTSIESGTIVRVGTIINIQDPMRAGVRRGGRIKTGVSTTQIIVDDSNHTDLAATGNATLSVILSDGTLETKTISSVSGSTVTVSSAFSSVPQTNSVWVIENDSLSLQTFRVISVKEVDLIEYEIVAVVHNSSKYNFVEDGSTLQTKTITTLTALKDPPANLTTSEQIVVLNNRAVSKLFITFEPVRGVTEYLVQYRFNNENFISERISRPDFTILETKKGTYEIRVFSFNALGNPSNEPSTVTAVTIGKTALPQDVSNLVAEPISDQFIRLRFDKATDVDVLHGGSVVVRHSNLTDGTGTFTKSVDLIPAVSGAASEIIIPAIEGEVILKFRDDGGRLSNGETSVILTVPDPFPKLTVFTDREDTDSTPFDGTKNNCTFDSVLSGLILGNAVLLDSVSDFDSILSFDSLGTLSASLGLYDFASKLDLGGKQPLKLTRHIVSQGFYPSDLFDDRTALIDTWTDFDGAKAEDVNAKLLVSHSDSAATTSVSATYSQSASTITITKNSHGYSVGSNVEITFSSGNSTSGNFEILTAATNSFTVAATDSQTTSGNCTYSAEFSKFQTFANGIFTGRTFRFRAELTSTDVAQSIEIEQLGYSAQLESRTETSLGNAGATNGVISSGTSQKAVSFTNTFFTGAANTSVGANSVLPSIGITIENAQSGDFFTLSSITGSGFNIDIKNGSSHVDRNFKYAATGFGRGS